MTLKCNREECGERVEVKKDLPRGWNRVKINGSDWLYYCEKHFVSVGVRDRSIRKEVKGIS